LFVLFGGCGWIGKHAEKTHHKHVPDRSVEMLVVAGRCGLERGRAVVE
jgi:hypothetical protein